MFIYPYMMGSNSVKNLKESLGAKIIKLQGSNFKGDESKIVINWGNSTPHAEMEKCLVLNTPEHIKTVSNKHLFFELVKGQCRIPEFTVDKTIAHVWCNEGSPVIVREKLTGHSGEGIVVLENSMEFDNYDHSRAKLYVKYIPKKQEYRVHIVGDQIVFTQRKAKRNDVPDNMVNWRVRNHGNGFVFVKNENVPIPYDVHEQSRLAIKASDLDFGAVDVVWNEYKQQATVLEINTAPGLEGTSGEQYAEALKAYAIMCVDMDLTEDDLGGKKKKKNRDWGNVNTFINALAFENAEPVDVQHVDDDPEGF